MGAILERGVGSTNLPIRLAERGTKGCTVVSCEKEEAEHRKTKAEAAEARIKLRQEKDNATC